MFKYLLAGLIAFAPMSAHAGEAFNVEREIQSTAVVYCQAFDEGTTSVEILDRAETYISNHVPDHETKDWLRMFTVTSLLYGTQYVCPEHKDETSWIVNALSPKQPKKELPYSFKPSRQRLA